jgi:hypothetical protein
LIVDVVKAKRFLVTKVCKPIKDAPSTAMNGAPGIDGKAASANDANM